MNTRPLFVLGALVLAAGGAMAADASNGTEPLTRAEVRQSVIDARANGELRPAGEAGDEAWTPAQAPRSTLTRAEVAQQVAAARAAGQLAPVGEAGDEFFAAGLPSNGPGLTRGQVVAETLLARDAGLLQPAGQGLAGDDLVRAESQHQFAVAHERHHVAAAPGAAISQ